MMVEPSKKMEEVYDLLLTLENFLLEKLKPGVLICDVYRAAIDCLKEKNPDLVQYIITANFG
jgi:nucleosome binding factor SPN SPT16 subunit